MTGKSFAVTTSADLWQCCGISCQEEEGTITSGMSIPIHSNQTGILNPGFLILHALSVCITQALAPQVLGGTGCLRGESWESQLRGHWNSWHFVQQTDLGMGELTRQAPGMEMHRQWNIYLAYC